MATLTQTAQPNRPPGKDKKIFRSISKFLSGGKSRSKLPAPDQGPPQAQPPSQGPPDGAGAGADTLADAHLHDGTSTIGGRSEGESASLAESGVSVGADTAASVRALPPRSTAPSVLTRSTSAAGSVANSLGGTYKSDVSTKPTTVMSVDSGAGANRIAVVPGTGHSFAGAGLASSSSTGSIAHQPPSPSTQTSTNGVTFSALPPANPIIAPTSPPPESYPDADDPAQAHDDLSLSAANVPRHTRADPRNNPHPAYPPPDNASMLTLASSSFAPSFTLARPTTGAGGGGSVAGSGAWSGGGLTGLRAWRDRGDGASSIGGGTIDRADEDASVRALVGSRRASEESLGARSTWSAAVLLNSVGNGSGKPASVLTRGTTETHETDGTGGDEGETEAQKVVRHEGDRNLVNDHEAISRALAAGTQPVDHTGLVEVDGLEHDTTPTEEKEEKDATETLAPEGATTPLEGSTTAGATPVLESTAIVPEEAVATSLPINADAEADSVPHANATTPLSSVAVSDSEDEGMKTPLGAGLTGRDRTQSFASGYETATVEKEEGGEVRKEELA